LPYKPIDSWLGEIECLSNVRPNIENQTFLILYIVFHIFPPKLLTPLSLSDNILVGKEFIPISTDFNIGSEEKIKNKMKTGKKRGRPGITPHVKALVFERVLEERRKHPEKRMPVNVLAHNIQKELIEQGEEKPPKLSTLEKMISSCSNETNPEDEPWSIDSLGEFPIAPEALPKVLEEYKRHKDEGTELTIREAKWIARLSATEWAKGDLPSIIARTELLYELIKRPPDLEGFDRFLAGLSPKKTDNLIPFVAAASLIGILKDDPIKQYFGKIEKAQKERQPNSNGKT
jgi:hypothetical protein